MPVGLGNGSEFEVQLFYNELSGPRRLKEHQVQHRVSAKGVRDFTDVYVEYEPSHDFIIKVKNLVPGNRMGNRQVMAVPVYNGKVIEYLAIGKWTVEHIVDAVNVKEGKEVNSYYLQFPPVGTPGSDGMGTGMISVKLFYGTLKCRPVGQPEVAHAVSGSGQNGTPIAQNALDKDDARDVQVHDSVSDFRYRDSPGRHFHEFRITYCTRKAMRKALAGREDQSYSSVLAPAHHPANQLPANPLLAQPARAQKARAEIAAQVEPPAPLAQVPSPAAIRAAAREASRASTASTVVSPVRSRARPAVPEVRAPASLSSTPELAGAIMPLPPQEEEPVAEQPALQRDIRNIADIKPKLDMSRASDPSPSHAGPSSHKRSRPKSPARSEYSSSSSSSSSDSVSDSSSEPDSDTDADASGLQGVLTVLQTLMKQQAKTEKKRKAREAKRKEKKKAKKAKKRAAKKLKREKKAARGSGIKKRSSGAVDLTGDSD